jgi:hypothetical protein
MQPWMTGLALGLLLAVLVVLALTWLALDARLDLDVGRAGVLMTLDLVRSPGYDGGLVWASLDVTPDQVEGWLIWPSGTRRWLCVRCR